MDSTSGDGLEYFFGDGIVYGKNSDGFGQPVYLIGQIPERLCGRFLSRIQRVEGFSVLEDDAPKVLIERYGDTDGECLFTVRNETDKPVDAILRPSPELFAVAGLLPVWRTADKVPLENWVFRVRLAPWSTEVFLPFVR